MAAGDDTISSSLLKNQNKVLVYELYKELDREDTNRVSRLLADDLEWWFHGPQNCQYMMKILTGESTGGKFRFEPRRISSIEGGKVVAEGWEGATAYWVHVWTIKDGLITQFREYFNTWLTVTEIIIGNKSPLLWQSQPRDLFNRSLPGLVLAI